MLRYIFMELFIFCSQKALIIMIGLLLVKNLGGEVALRDVIEVRSLPFNSPNIWAPFLY